MISRLKHVLNTELDGIYNNCTYHISWPITSVFSVTYNCWCFTFSKQLNRQNQKYYDFKTNDFRYDKEQLQVKYPYLNVQDIVLGSDCSEGEGWFDPWLLLSAYRYLTET